VEDETRSIPTLASNFSPTAYRSQAEAHHRIGA